MLALGTFQTALLLATPVTAQTAARQPDAARPSDTVELAIAPRLDAFLTETRERCGHTAQAERFVQALGVELASASFTPPDASDTRMITCDPDAGTLLLWLFRRELRLDVSDVPSAARARTLAVAFAETLRLPPDSVSPADSPGTAVVASQVTSGPTQALSTQTPSTHTPLTTAPATVDAVPTSQASPLVDSSLQVPIALGVTVIGPQQTLAVGARIGLSIAVVTTVRLSTHLGYLTAYHESALGQARLHTATLESSGDVVVWQPSQHSSVELGASVGVYRAGVVVSSAWGIDEPNKHGWFALYGLHALVSTLLHDEVRIFTQLGGTKDILGLRLRAGGQQAMSFHGFGAQLRLGAAYVF